MAERPSRRRRRREEVLARLQRIRDSEDRSASFALLDALLSGSLDDASAEQVTDTLITLEDPRCAPALLRAVHDSRVPFGVRAAALEILSSTPCDDPPRGEVRRWAQSHDPLVRALGVQYLDVPESDLIAAAASDPEPIVRRVAVEAMASLVRTPTLVGPHRRALRDEDALVREVACRVALFDEPLECSWDLLRVLADPSTIVRSAAFDALEWYPRISVVLALADARTPERPGRADAVLDALARRIRAALESASSHARRRLERWVGPVAWLLGGAAAESRRGAAPGGAPRTSQATPLRRVDADEAAAVLADPDAPPSRQRDLLLRRSWARCGRRGLDVLRACARSPNWGLRQLAARPLSHVGAWEPLRDLALDREPVVRRAALVAALEAREPCDGGLVDAARECLRDPWVRPTAGDHALALVASRAAPEEIEAVVLDELSRPDDRDGLFLGAIHLARLASVRRAVPALLAIVNAPVVAGVAAHVAALHTLRALGHPRTRIDLRHLDGVDHLDVQREVGEWGWRGARWG